MTPQRAAWHWLARELDRWGEAGLQARFWWRDDDASSPGPKLDRLAELSATHGVPLALAVIPHRVDAGFGGWLEAWPLLTVLQHGFAHINHAGAGDRSIELGGNRPPERTLADLARGHARLVQVFGAHFVPVLVPPWNRIATGLLPELSPLGLSGLSTMRVRKTARPAAGLLQVNAHLDPVHWRGDRGFIGSYPSIAILVQHLLAKRTGYRDRDEPTGLLTHHLAQNEAVWRFTERLLLFVDEHPAAEWIGAPEIWP